MKTGDVVLIPFPFAELNAVKARPAVVICTTSDKFHDLVVSAISSVISGESYSNEFTISPDGSNGLRVPSLVKVDRIVTGQASSVIVKLGELSAQDRQRFIAIFRSLV